MKVRRFALHTVTVGLALSFAMSGASIALAETQPQVKANGVVYTYPGATVGTGTAAVTAWVSGPLAQAVNRAPATATRSPNSKKRRIDFTAPRNGVTLDVAGSISKLEAAIAETSTLSARPVNLDCSITAPAVTGFGKTILVVLKQRKIYLYSGTGVWKKYSCAIGMPKYPTPTGTFIIKRKVKGPSWTNPGGAWGKGMPAYIAPGPGNPLGTRALYLYRNGRDTGVRFHGTTNTSSIGHAASHGCMRMKRKDVEKFYNQVPLGTTVYIVK
jgi:lipoprotein-anchoring transpeptidase ErfK/SrfK